MFLTVKYFTGELNIPNSDAQHVQDLIQTFIEKYEPLVLTHVLGYELYAELKAGTVSKPYATKWSELLNGKDYTYNSKARHWRGIVDQSIDGLPQSFLANYVYYYYMKFNFTQTAAMGEVTSKNENSIPANPGLKMVRAWNEGAVWIAQLQHFLNASYSDTYTTWTINSRHAAARFFQPINIFDL
jgi:hypothetical protein